MAPRNGENAVLEQVAARVGSPTVDRADVFNSLSIRTRELSDMRYVRIAKRLGIGADWGTLFAEIGRRSKDDQAKAARVIVIECGLKPDTSLEKEEMLLGVPVTISSGFRPARTAVD